MDLILRKNYEREREVNKQDKYYVVEIEVQGLEESLKKKVTAKLGWIEKKFVKEDFIKATTEKLGMPFLIKNVSEYSNENNYQRALTEK